MSEQFQVTVDANGGASVENAAPTQPDYTKAADYVPDDPIEETETGQETTEQTESDSEPEKTVEEPIDEEALQQKYDASLKDVQTASQFIESKGLSYEQFLAEYARDGHLSESSYAKLEAAGIPRTMVDSYYAGQQALYESWVNHVQSFVGGEKNYATLMQYASTHLTDREKAAYDEAVNSGDIGRAKTAVQSLLYQFGRDYPADGYEYEGNSGNSAETVQGFATPEEAYAAEEDPRMYTDPAYRANFNARLMKTAFLKG